MQITAARVLRMLWCCAALILVGKLSALEIIPAVVGNGQADSILASFETFDTSALPLLANPDSLKILRFGPAGDLLDSLGEDAPMLSNLRAGSFELRLRAADSAGRFGKYLIRVYAYKGNQIRGAASGGYYVRGDNWEGLDSARMYTEAVLDTLNNGFASQINQGNLDAAVSSRSTLTESDNIGINWVDIENPGAFQYFPGTIIGSVSGLVTVDSARIARAVWDNDVVIPELREVNLSACGAGTGAYPCSLYVRNSADSAALQGVKLRFLNASQTATEAMGVSNSEGLVVASLDAALYLVWAYRAGVEFSPLPDSVNVNEPAVADTIWGSAFDPGAPPSPELCRVYGWVYDLAGEGLCGVTVSTALAASPVRYCGALISPYYKTSLTDSSGYWQIDLLPNAILEPSDCRYEFVIYYEAGRIARKKVNVPRESSWRLDW